MILLLGPEEKARIHALASKAEKNKVGYQAIKAAAESGSPRPLPIFVEQTIEIPHAFTVTFSIEEHAPSQWLRHISVGVRSPGGAPNVEAVRMLMKEFGYAMTIEQCEVWPETLLDGSVAVNVLEPVSGSWKPLLNA